MIKGVNLFIVCICLLCCCSESSKVSQNAQYTIDLEKISSIDTSIVTDVKYVPLETTQESAFGNIYKLKADSTGFYILDRRYSKSILKFTVNGQFCFKIKNIGKGSGEYISCTDFDIDNRGRIYLWDHQLMKVIIYDSSGKFLDENKMNFTAEQFCLLGIDSYLFNSTEGEKGQAQVLIYDKKTKECYNKLTARDYFDTNYRIPDFTFYRLSKFNNHSYYCPPFSTSIFQVEKEGMKKFIDFLPSNLVPTKSKLKQIYPMKPDRAFGDKFNGKIVQTVIASTAKYINIKLLSDNIQNVFISKTSNRFYMTKSIPVDEGSYVSDIRAATKEHFIGYILPFMLEKVKKRTNAKELLNLTLESNPTLILFKIKDF